MSDTPLDHWRLRRDDEGIAWLDADRAGEAVNSLDAAMLAALGSALDRLEAEPPRGLVIGSAKASGFILGADVREFDQHDDAAAVAALIGEVHALFERLENAPYPTVAAIDGYCLGGGLELALCCDWLIATGTDNTRIGLPEVKLGIFPGFGGSVRLPRRIGPLRALPLMLTGRLLRAPAARAQGLIDEVVDRHGSLHWRARAAVLRGRRSRSPGLLARCCNSAPLRPLLAAKMRQQTAAKVRRAHYPAPFRLIDTWAAHGGGDRAAHFAAEARAVGELVVGDSARGLRRVFQLMETMKKTAKAADFSARRVHVVGAGVMGADIAAWCALRGMEVTLQDREQGVIDDAIARVDKLFKKRSRGSAQTLAATRARLIGDLDGRGVANADVVIEAIVEDLHIKRALFATIEPRLKPGAILASNTSSLPLEQIGAQLGDPNRLIGLHFFNPVAQMPLVEVIHGERSAREVVEAGLAFALQIGKQPLAVKSTPGFLVNRVLAPYMACALAQHVEHGHPLADVDEAALRFGMPMGPLELADVVGIDVCKRVTDTLGAGERVRALMDEAIAAGKLGKKSGQGLYQWQDGKALKPHPSASAEQLDAIAAPMIEALIVECRAVEAEGLVQSRDLLDAGIVFGTGFAPFRGGPLHYADSRAVAAAPATTEQEPRA